MNMDEKRLSRYIDELNKGITPREHKNGLEDTESRKMLAAIRRVKAMGGIQYPDDLFQKSLTDSLTGGEIMQKKKNSFIKRTAIFTAAAAAAAVLLFVTVDYVIPGKDVNIVYAMEKAMEEVKAYHGIVVVTETNGLGETVTQSRREVWVDRQGNYYIKELEGTSEGLVTANNGEQKWQLRPEEEKAYLFTAFPDAYRFTFELGNEIDDVTKALTVKILGPETVGGRETTKLEITPDGGDAYHLWVDKETDLPLKRQSAMQNALQIQVSYESIDFMDRIPGELLVYTLPEGYAEVNTHSEQIVSSLEEAEELIGFLPELPEDIPGQYALDKIAVDKQQEAVKLYYTAADNGGTVLITEAKASGELAAASTAVLGSVNGNKAEIITGQSANSIRWKEQSLEYTVLGDVTVNELTIFAEGLSAGKVVLPGGIQDTEGTGSAGGTGDTGNGDSNEGTIREPQVKVEVDLAIEESDQKSADAGHSPWKLDPAFVAQVFASLLLSPEGITGDYPIAYENIEIIANDGVNAVAEIKDENSVAGYVYLSRLIRQDDTGIWTVVGYDKK